MVKVSSHRRDIRTCYISILGAQEQRIDQSCAEYESHKPGKVYDVQPSNLKISKYV